MINYFPQYCGSKLKLWIHSTKGETVARFDVRFGMDIHCSLEEQLQGNPQCLHCTHEKPTKQDFYTFCRKVKELFNVKIQKDKIKI
jgi:hypothetical protein